VRRDPAGKYEQLGRVLLVGELNPYGSNPLFALWDEPADASGNRLREILGLRSDTYRALHRVNLCAGRWSMRAAREKAGLLTSADPSRPWDVVVMLGRKVASAFGYRGDFFGVVRPREVPGLQGKPEPTLVSLPHPSGLCRVWNDPAAVGRARDLVRAVAPWVPWGEVWDGQELHPVARRV